MKYMLMMNTPRGGDYGINTWPKKDIEAHIGFMISFAKKLSQQTKKIGVRMTA